MDCRLDEMLDGLVRMAQEADLEAGHRYVNKALVLADVEAAGGRELANAVDTLIGQLTTYWADAGLTIGYHLARDPGLILFEGSGD
jgi:hypothetical protein